MNNQDLQLAKQAAFNYGFQKAAVFGIGTARKALGSIPWGEGPQLGMHGMPAAAGYGSILGGLGNLALGDESQTVAERLIKGMLYGAGGGAAASIPIGIAGMTASQKLLANPIARYFQKRQALAELARRSEGAPFNN